MTKIKCEHDNEMYDFVVVLVLFYREEKGNE